MRAGVDGVRAGIDNNSVDVLLVYQTGLDGSNTCDLLLHACSENKSCAWICVIGDHGMLLACT
jgi:hypothetical protein